MSKRSSRPAWYQSLRYRAGALYVVHLLGLLLLGRAIILPGIPDDDWASLDRWMRDASFAVLAPSVTTPVTFVDIDDALYRETWGMPATTPRDALLAIISAVTDGEPQAVVVDIDLAWGPLHPGLNQFLRNYRGPARLVLVRRLQEDAGRVQDVTTPYDATVAENDEWLAWGHAYFYSDQDGKLREWLPAVPICRDRQTDWLLSTTLLATATAPPVQTSTKACQSLDDLPALPIIYTEDYGFSGAPGGATEGAMLWMRDIHSPARRLAASALLNNSSIDPASVFTNRIVIIGGSHTSGQDQRLTPLGILPGAVVQANTMIHAVEQMRDAATPVVRERLVVAALFTLLVAFAFPFAAALLVLVVLVAVGLYANYAIFGQAELAVILYIQFRFMVWLVTPFWKAFREQAWRIILPDYFTDKSN